MKVGPIVCIVCLKTKEIIYINENRYFCRELKDDSLRKKFRSLAQKLREIILKQNVAILSGTPVSISSSINNTTKLQNVSSSVLSTNEHQRNAPVFTSSPIETVQASVNTSMVLDLSKKIDLLMIKVENLTTEQAKLNYSTDNAIHLINECNKQITVIQEFAMNKFCPFVFELCEAFIGNNKKVKTNEPKSSLPQLKKDWKVATKSIVSSSRSNISLTNSSPDESVSNDI